MSRQSRQYTRELLEMMDEGLLDPQTLVLACVNYMSEDDVLGMMRANDILLPEEDEDESDV